ncbi:uncharacterized protein METZ01_LOCUS71143 [marine metagenome]|uniref:DUF3179 domain-containing protein n=1 Tax=marine metagenome TaxID=408172 RepID=A0A381TR44_9ZZZZ
MVQVVACPSVVRTWAPHAVRLWALACLASGSAWLSPISVPVAFAQTAGTVQATGHPDIELFLVAGSAQGTIAQDALVQVGDRWRPGYAGIIWDLARSLRPPGPQMFRFFSLLEFLQKQTGQDYGGDLARWKEWIWSQPYEPHPDYGFFKGQWYSRLDPDFSVFFPRGVRSLIRLDEVEWGGVGVNGIPPLEYPPHLKAGEVGYLEDHHIVFGLSVGSETRAYPKRILAWHELALDQLGGAELTIVYCTLCGTVIPFDSMAEGRRYTFGTSGLLYRSNKLMFDHETSSLWNTFEGTPVVGALAGSGVRLTHRAVVTTTWGEWKRMHPETTVLSLDTGFERNYAEGAAYRDYFGSDALMFQVARWDDRLPNKAEVLVLRSDDSAPVEVERQLAIAASFLQRNRVFEVTFSGRPLVVVTSPEGGNRVYDAGGRRFERHLDEAHVIDREGRSWRITEEALVLDDEPNVQRGRVPAQRAFWFGWYAQFPDTQLIH